MKAILTYHSIDASGSPISVDEATFARHVDWLASGRVAVRGLADLLAAPAGEDAVALTFDDALANFGSRAWPLLRDAGLPVTLFVPTARVGSDNQWSATEPPQIPRLALLDWPALARLAEEGVRLGSHGRTHRDLRRLDDGELEAELTAPAEAIAAETGTRPDALAYPYGHVDERVARAAASRYRFACTAELRPLARIESPHLLPRIDAWYLRRPGLLEAWGSRRLRLYLGLRAAARRLRARLRSTR